MYSKMCALCDLCHIGNLLAQFVPGHLELRFLPTGKAHS